MDRRSGRSRATLIGAGLLLVGAAVGWLGRGRYDRAAMERVRTEALDPEPDPEHAVAASPIGPKESAPERGPETHDDELRRILGDPKGRALAAKVRNAARVGDACEVEVDTSIGWFRVGCGTGETPSVGDKFEVFGRDAPDGQVEGEPVLLRPSWLEPIGTIARLRGGG